jgi:protein-tyrosine phosphatase
MYKIMEKKAIKWFIATMMVMACLHVYAQSEGVSANIFDLYNDLAEQSSNPELYYAIVDSYKEQLATGSMSDEEVTEAKAALRIAIFDHMNTVPAKAGQYDITRFVTNTTFTNNSKDGWTFTKNGGGWQQNSDFEVNNGIAECFGKNNMAAIYQTIHDMPTGTYTLKVQGFYRNGEWKQALANYERGKDVVKASLFIDDSKSQTSPMKSIFEDGCYMLECTNNKSADVFAIISGRGFPHSHTVNGTWSSRTQNLAKKVINHGHYWNEMTAYHAGGNLTIGITLSAGAPSENWVICDNFRLYYGLAGPVIVSDDPMIPSTEVSDDMKADVILRKHFTAGEMTPLAVPCNISASYFQAVYGIGALDEKTRTAILYPMDEVQANIPCFVMTAQDVDEIVVENTYVTAAQIDQFPVLWDGGVIYRVDENTWKTTTVSEEERDASFYTHYEYVDPLNMDFVANIENFRARQFLENTDYSDPNTPSVIGNYFKPAPPRLDIPHNIAIPLPAEKVVNATVRVGLQSDFSDAKNQIILDKSSYCYIPNLIPDNTYYFLVEAGGEVLTRGKFQVEGPARMIYAPSISNIRDLGGWTVQGNKQVRYGLLFRGGEANGQHSSVLEDRQTLMDLGVGAEVDLRCSNQYDSGKGEVGTCAFGFDEDDYYFWEGCQDKDASNLTNDTSKKRFKKWFNFILSHIRDGKAVYFHCVWGADRTGLTAVLLEGLLGFSQEQMNLEYELTSLSFAGNRPKNGTPGYGDHQQIIEAIKQYGGETLRDKFDTYWTQEVGITMDEIKEFRSIMLDPTESIVIGNTNIATYYSPNALNFSWTKDVKAYIVSTFNPETGQVTLTRVKEIPAETGVIVKGQAGTFDIPLGESKLVVTNLLKGVTTPTVMNKEEGGYTNFILAKKNGNIGFYPVKDGSTLGANKAYLPLPTTDISPVAESKISMVFNDEEEDEVITAVIEIEDVTEERTTDIYNISGQRVKSLQKGVNIIGRKKIFVK